MEVPANMPRFAPSITVLVAVMIHQCCVPVHSAEYTIVDIGLHGFEPQRPQIDESGQTAVYFGDVSASRFEFGDPSALTDILPLFPNGAALNGDGELLGLVSGTDPLRLNLQLLRNGSTTIVGSITRELDHASIVSHNDSGSYVGIHYTDYLTNVRSFAGVLGQNEADIGSLGGNFTLATDINNLGRIVGISHTGATPAQVANGSPVEEAFVRKNGEMHGIGTLGGESSYANAINDADQIVGASATADHIVHAFLYDSNVGMQDIGSPGEASYALDINNNSNVVGVEIDGVGKMHAFIHDDAHGLRRLTDLVSANNGWTELREADAINDLGQIVGIGILRGEPHAFLLTPIPEPAPLMLLAVAALTSKLLLRRRGVRRDCGASL